MRITHTPPITIQPWPLPPDPWKNPGIVPPWLQHPPKPPNGNPGIVPPWLQPIPVPVPAE